MKSQTIDASRVQVVAFDLFGTVVDFSGVPRDELRAYADHIRKPEWSPFRPPASWAGLKAFPDSAKGLAGIRAAGRDTAILSNCPWRLAQAICDEQWITFDHTIQLAAARVFKPDPRAYQVACDVLDVEPESVLMVTANEHFGDLEQSRVLGMQACLIRGESDVPDLIELARRLEGDA